jgi:hypothetical protein
MKAEAHERRLRAKEERAMLEQQRMLAQQQGSFMFSSIRTSLLNLCFQR